MPRVAFQAAHGLWTIQAAAAPPRPNLRATDQLGDAVVDTYACGCHTSRRRLPFRPRGPELRCHHRLHKVWSVMATNAQHERARTSARGLTRAPVALTIEV